ncbi:hypothetical protein JJL56_31780 [Azospirillum sp. YIM DDC1]|uniref:Calcium-binding protein n=1 Tax=Azospirillum aestuarii TaxID=2802052 RepID=A0ABS1I8R6_9PROT|nr:calcium-binding protein [Azospirillum aestuarii]MBK4723433.1 hypothetical protein [Azospirillum aestuarii]
MATYYGDAYANNLGPYSGPNTIYGGAGNDTIYGYTDNDRLSGDDGDDQITGWFGNDTIFGGNGNDFLDGWDNDDIIYGEAGNDTIYGGENADTINGGAGDDYIYGDYDIELGQDVLTGGAGNDTIEGGSDNDFYIFNFGTDGQDYYYDSQGSYDTVRVNGVTNISQLTITSAANYGGSANNLVIHKDGTLAEYVQIHDFFSGGGYGAGYIEYLDVNGSVFWLSNYIDAV